MIRSVKWALWSLLLAIGAITGTCAVAATPGFIALEGSDSTALHQDPQYTPQLFSYLQGSSSLPVLVFGTVTLDYTGGVAATYVTNLSGIDFSNYSALYIEAPGGCCVADNTVLNGYGTAVNNFIANGGNLSIENYVGGGYDGVVPGGASAPFGTILGAGAGGGSTCTDGELLTAFGASHGFTQPPYDGCWEHQAYEMTYWGGLGYQSLMQSDPTGYTFADGTNLGSAFLALGGSLGTPIGGVPEPATWAMLLLGFGFVGGVMRSAKRRSEPRVA